MEAIPDELLWKNAADTDRYNKWREEREEVFKTCTPVQEYRRESISPSGKYKLVITPMKPPDGWDYCLGVITDLAANDTVFTVYRNYGSFPFLWVQHKNGNEYLLCGEDYQGYMSLNLTQHIKTVFFPYAGFKGWGFCWSDAMSYDPEEISIKVEGCYWGAQYEYVTYDFSHPDQVPFPDLRREDVPIPLDPEDEEAEVKD